ncbi:hypothetical protein, partial [Vibrio cholerae]|uniref:hypothetical protein n=1 Tax=Vibrio cholerae TaxID=666 RepID=UPI00227070DD
FTHRHAILLHHSVTQLHYLHLFNTSPFLAQLRNGELSNSFHSLFEKSDILTYAYNWLIYQLHPHRHQPITEETQHS